MTEAAEGIITTNINSPATSEEIKALNWEAHDLEDTLRVLNRDQAIDSAQTVGERFAAAINSKSKAELIALASGFENDDANGIIDHLLCAEKSLEFRSTLVRCALARLMAVAESISN